VAVTSDPHGGGRASKAASHTSNTVSQSLTVDDGRSDVVSLADMRRMVKAAVAQSTLKLARPRSATSLLSTPVPSTGRSIKRLRSLDGSSKKLIVPPTMDPTFPSLVSGAALASLPVAAVMTHPKLGKMLTRYVLCVARSGRRERTTTVHTSRAIVAYTQRPTPARPNERACPLTARLRRRFHTSVVARLV
jgi:hypothetical protein